MTDEWYYARNGQQLGPVTLTALRGLLASGQVKSSDLVWHEGMSNWLPAGDSRELFSVRPGSAAPAAAMPARAEVPPARSQRRVEEDTPVERCEPRPRRRRASAGGMSTGAKIVIFGGIAGFLLVVCLSVAGVVIWVASTTATTTHDSGTYTLDLYARGQQNIRTVQWQAGKKVDITLTTTEWGGGQQPTVVLYVLDSNGKTVAVDQSNVPKDCWTNFTVPTTGQYRIVVVLERGNRAHCVVRY